MLSKVELREKLSKNFATVTFTKSDGSVRVMNCTLMDEYIPSAEPLDESPKIPRKQNDNVFAVWDIDNKGWRSFRIESVIKIEYINTGVNNAAST